MSDQGFRTTDPWPGGEIATLRAQLTALQATADRYRETLSAIAEYDTDWQINPYANVTRLQAMAERALADTSPPAQPAGTTTFTNAEGQPVHNPTATSREPAAQTVALRPAREVAEEAMRDWPAKIQPLLRLGVLDKITAAIESDRAQRGLDRATVEACARACETAGCECMHAPCEHDEQRKASAAAIRDLLSSPRGAR